MGRLSRRVSRRLQFIMPQAEDFLLRRRNRRVADDQLPPARRWSKETRRNGLLEMESLSDRHRKRNPGLAYQRQQRTLGCEHQIHSWPIANLLADRIFDHFSRTLEE